MPLLIAAASLLGTLQGFSLGGDAIPVSECKMTYRKRVLCSIDHPGLIARIPEEGTQVHQGDLLVQLRDEIPRANLAVAAARVESAALQVQVEQTAAESAQLEYDAALEANRQAKGAAYPATHLARLKLTLKAAELKAAVAKEEHQTQLRLRDQAQAELDAYHVNAEFSGIIVQVFKHASEGIQQGESVVELVNVSQLRVEGYVSLQDAIRLATGLPATVSLELPSNDGSPVTKEIQTKLGFVDASVHTLSNRVRVWADIENGDGQLREGLPVRMSVTANKR